MSFPAAVPEIPVRDLDDAIAYWRDILGFTFDFRDDDSGIAGMSRGACRVFFTDVAFRGGNAPATPIVVWLNFDDVAGVDAQYAEWLATGARLEGAPELKPWGLHEFTALDLDGNVLRVFHIPAPQS